MKSQALQEMVKKIFSDEATRSEFMKDPSGVVARFNLTVEEKSAVMTTHAKFGLISANSGTLEAAVRPTWEWYAPAP